MNEKLDLEVAILPFFDLVLFPQSTIPLVISDKAYIQLVENAIEKNTPIAICLAEPVFKGNGPKNSKMIKTRKIAGIGIPHIIKRRQDGSLQILLEGVGKVRLSHMVSDGPYLTFKGQLVEEEGLPHSSLETKAMQRLKRVFHSWSNKQFSSEEDRKAVQKRLNTPEEFLNYMAMFVVQDREVKQLLLECDSLFERYSLLSLLFRWEGIISEDPMASASIKNFDTLEKHAAHAH